MDRWADLMKQLGGGEVTRVAFNDELFHWLEKQFMGIDEYPYGGVDI